MEIAKLWTRSFDMTFPNASYHILGCHRVTERSRIASAPYAARGNEMGARHGRSRLVGVRSFGRLRRRRGSIRTLAPRVACGSGFARGGREQGRRRLEERREKDWPTDRSRPHNCEEGGREIRPCSRDGAEGNRRQDRAEGRQQTRRR